MDGLGALDRPLAGLEKPRAGPISLLPMSVGRLVPPSKGFRTEVSMSKGFAPLMISNLALLIASCTAVAAPAPASASAPADPAQTGESTALTVYNQGFAVVRESFALELKAGLNEIRRSGTTAQLEPDSVIFRDPTGAAAFRVLEQSYRNDPVSQGLLLSMFEGQEIDFQRELQGLGLTTVRGRILRSGYDATQARQGNYYSQQQPLIEVGGKLQFQLPGVPLFPSLGSDTILQPTLSWRVDSPAAARFQAELAYVTAGLSWKADYNLVAPAAGDIVDLVGWITVDNKSGKRFDDARMKLMAGDVNKIQTQNMRGKLGMMPMAAMERDEGAVVTEKSFDEYHLYTLANPATIRDGETKQVEFVRAAGLTARRLFAYDGASQGQFWLSDGANQDPGYGTQSQKKIWVMREFHNSAANRLGMPMPKGRLRFYQRDDDAQLEFLGENEIDHTPKDEWVRVYVGNSFDLVGERSRTDFKVDSRGHWMDESFEITLRNHKREAAQVRVVEHLYRWTNWQIVKPSQEWKKQDAQTIEFDVDVPADGEVKVAYTVHYTW
jgi:hypothetical protein